MSQLEKPVLSDADVYRMVRSQIEFEDGLITQRLSWFVAAQSFLFTAYAINLTGAWTGLAPELKLQRRLLFDVVPIVAIASCMLIYFGILAGVAAQKKLRDLLCRLIPADRREMFPGIHGTGSTRMFGMAAPLGLPPVFITVWLVLLVRGMTMF